MIYLDNAATTFPKPQPVAKNVLNAVRVYGGNPGRGGHPLSMKTSQAVFKTRELLSGFFGVAVENIVFTSNCTHALNMAIKGVLRDGGHVIISSMEHNSVIRPIYSLAKQGIIEYDVAPVYEGDTEKTLQSFAQLLRPNTRAIVCTHASNVTGMILPIRELGQLCRQQNITFIVDGAQSAGVLPVNLPEMGIDIFCTAGHKGLYGTTGTGLMVFNTNELPATILEGGTGSLSVDLNQPDFLPDRYESGTINTVGILSLEAGVSYIKRLGFEKIHRHEFQLCKSIYDEIHQYPNVKTYVRQYTPERFVPILLFNLEGRNSVEVVEQFSARGYCLRGGLHCSPLAHQALGTSEIGGVRISPSIFTTKNEITAFLKDFKQIANI